MLVLVLVLVLVLELVVVVLVIVVVLVRVVRPGNGLYSASEGRLSKAGPFTQHVWLIVHSL